MQYEKTYRTIKELYKKIYDSGIKAFLVGGMSVAIQTDMDFYRKNEDLDLMVNVSDLEQLTQLLSNLGYKVLDRRGAKTENYVDIDGVFHAANHELDTEAPNDNMLGLGLFTYERKDGEVVLNSYAYDERLNCAIGSRKVMPEELFDLMYSSEEMIYHGTPVLSQSKAYTYLTKSKGTRPKDKMDAEFLEPFIDEKEKAKIQRINTLQRRVKHYMVKYDARGEVVSSKKVPELEDAVFSFISDMAKKNPNVSPNELYNGILGTEKIQKILAEREDIADILRKLKTVESATLEELAQNAKTISHLYCYSDDFESDFAERYGKKGRENDFISQLKSEVYLPEEQPEFIPTTKDEDISTKIVY